MQNYPVTKLQYFHGHDSNLYVVQDIEQVRSFLHLFELLEQL